MTFKARKIVNWFSLAILLIAVSFLLQGKMLVFLGYTAFAAIIFLPRVIYRRLGLHENFSNELLDWVEIAFSLALALSVAGYLWLFDKLYDYDAYVHFFTPFILCFLIAIFLSATMQHLKMKRVTKSEITLATLVVSMSLILIWELFEYFMTVKFGRNMFFIIKQPNDTLYDVVTGFLSLPLAAALIYKYHDWFFDKLSRLKK